MKRRTLALAVSVLVLAPGSAFAADEGSSGDALGAFGPAGSLHEARTDHSATLLPDGRVLVVGESSAGGASTRTFATVELWDPATRTFSPAGSLSEGRSGHTATLLPDGRVLIIGGGRPKFLAATTDWAMFWSSAVTWDPETGVFGPTGSLAEARTAHTATLLPDGRVLVIGGLGDEGTTASVEIWDPATASFELAGSLLKPRYGHTATLLHDGRVLVIGGS